MKNIVLLCSAGMSTSLLVTKMEQAAKAKEYECLINAYSLADSSNVVPDADIVLLGPQVRFQLGQLKKQYPDKIIESIEMRSYGTMNGEAVINFAIEKMQ